MASRSSFSDVEAAQPIEVFALTAKYNEDPNPNKVNLGVGAFRTEEGKPWVLPVVQSAEKQMANDDTLNHEYLPVAGLPAYRTAALSLLLGENSDAILKNRVEGIQALGGTGALRLTAEFCKRMFHMNCVYVSKPTWGNHLGIFKAAGFTEIKEYRYWKAENRSLDIEGMIEDLGNAPENAVIVLHACAHNPTGVDATHQQWERIANVCKERGLMVLMDAAYQGFSTGDLAADAWSVRYFVDQGFEFFVAQSFSKNFGLYNERVGNLGVIMKDSASKSAVKSQLEIIVRQMFSNPPNHGARVVATVLSNPALYNEWKECVKKMADRILLMRQSLFDKLKELGTPGTWTHVVHQTGMFSYTGLNPRQVEHLLSKYHIYLLKSGRINMCGLTLKTVEYVAAAIDDAVRNIPDDPKL